MKLTLLDMVQDILSDLNDDEVNSISDTVESLQVAQMIKSTFFEMIDNKNWPHLRKLISLEAVSDLNRPVYLRVSDTVKEVCSVEYNKRLATDPTRSLYSKVNYVTPDEFLYKTSKYNINNTNVEEIEDFSGAKFNIITDRHPEFYTSFDDEYLVFNSYNSLLDATLQEAHTRSVCYVDPSWSMVDSFVPDLPSEAFSALLAEAKSVCFVRLKQSPDEKAEQQSRRQRSWLSRKSFKVNGGIRLPSYGRRGIK